MSLSYPTAIVVRLTRAERDELNRLAEERDESTQTLARRLLGLTPNPRAHRGRKKRSGWPIRKKPILPSSS